MSNMTWATFDIETIPLQNLPDELRPRFDEASVKLGNLKDRFKIQEKMDEERAKFEASVDKTMGTDPDLCLVCAFVGHLSNGTKKEFKRNIFAPNEEAEFNLLASAWAWLRDLYKERIPIVSFNGKSFDLQVLRRRAMLQDVSVPPALYEALSRRFETKYHVDLMEVLGNRNLFSGKIEYKSMDWYLKRFGIGAKYNGMSGADVYPLYKEGEYQRILEYCQDDVLKISMLFERVAPWILAPTEPETRNETEGE
jgi:predicted PolB exonuclease-like 3'-5' exonuclease